MTRAESRLKILELARPQVSMPDVATWLKRADELEAWVNAPAPETPNATEGQAEAPPQKRGEAKSQQARRT